MAVSGKSEDKNVVEETTEAAEAENVDVPTIDVEPEVIANPTDKNSTTKVRGGFAAMLVGGAVAAVLGFGAAIYAQTSGWIFPKDNTELETLTVLVESQKVEANGLMVELANLKEGMSKYSTQNDLTMLDDRLGEQATSIIALSEQLEQALRRLADIENRPIPEVGATAEAVQTYERELSAMRQMFEEELARIDEAQKQAADAGKTTTEQAKSALKRASIARINAAIDSGVSFEDAISVLVSTGVSVPETLIAASESGVPTLTNLLEEFPEAARAALKASATPDPNSGNFSRFSAMLKAQFGARSLEPREGNDADAVLSRAEDALRYDNLDLAITELAGLSEPAMAQMTAWTERANIRLTAVTSVTALNTELNE